MEGRQELFVFGTDWNNKPLSELTARIVVAHHDRFRLELPALRGAAREVYACHCHRDFARLAPLPGLLFRLEDELGRHMRREEKTIFPVITALERAAEGREPMAANRCTKSLISATLSEHDDILDLLAEARQMTGNYEPPPNAGEQYRLLLQRFESLDRDLNLHIGMENDSIFSRALSLAHQWQEAHYRV
ncbi:MAG: Iron-sulfur cluster repair protein YtfE [Bryobacteraceae bacterium]|nr:Iron-sulfur cluster repair protein YtfE [Bryobacteraceae bacterium]